MKVQLIGFAPNLTRSRRIRIFREVVNSSPADLILFPGHTFKNEEELKTLRPLITNKESVVVFELQNSKASECLDIHNSLFILKDGRFENLFTGQLFTSSKEINGREQLVERLFDELPRRQVKCGKTRVTILQCGETAIISSSNDGKIKPEFRFKENGQLNRRFNEMLFSTDVFLNPIHTPQKRQANLRQRRALLSRDGRYYFSTSTLDKDSSGNLDTKSIQYACHDGRELSIHPDIYEKDGYVSRTIEIE